MRGRERETARHIQLRVFDLALAQERERELIQCIRVFWMRGDRSAQGLYRLAVIAATNRLLSLFSELVLGSFLTAR